MENLFPSYKHRGDGWTAALASVQEFVNMEFIQIGLSSKETKIACLGSFMRSLPEIVNSEGEDILLKYYKDKYSLGRINKYSFFQRMELATLLRGRISHY